MVAAAAQPILLVMLVLGGVAKLVTAGREAEPGALGRLGPAVLAPVSWRKNALIGCAIGEFGLAVGLLLVDHPAPRWMTVAFFTVATYVLWDLRRRRPDAGCGCFGDVSATPVGLRSISRTVVLTAMAVIVALDGAAGWPVVTWPVMAWLGGFVAVLLALSPEIEETYARLKYRAPCELRPFPPERAAARLRASTAWRNHAHLLGSEMPSDSWRELCWRFFVFEALNGAEVVFAVYLSGRRPPVRVAVVGGHTPIQESIPVSASL
ncbi:MauE/DoxX family redox-associated membrane protein [Herbidospora cretacea]|uniref:MauE/DoxX family redox-associated membrane protein n=1 Tax=Herbidospora cretacea TaxID=28444 RepID=UPI0007747496|nr:MauE/DoxX family redox-associated membrane protein [Herbidospora cretacea]